jgi:hypothetical protein
MPTNVEKNNQWKHTEVDVQDEHHNGDEHHEGHAYSSENSHDKTETHESVEEERKTSMKQTLKSTLTGLALIVSIGLASSAVSKGNVQVVRSVADVPVSSVNYDVERVVEVSDIGVVTVAKVDTVQDLVVDKDVADVPVTNVVGNASAVVGSKVNVDRADVVPDDVLEVVGSVRVGDRAPVADIIVG